MDTETRAAFTTLSAGFARMDRHFELQQKQFLEWRDELRGEGKRMALREERGV